MKRFVVIFAAAASLTGFAAPLADAGQAGRCPDSYQARRVQDAFDRAIDKNGNKYVCSKVNGGGNAELVIDDKVSNK
jgi:hypothetical protein